MNGIDFDTMNIAVWATIKTQSQKCLVRIEKNVHIRTDMKNRMSQNWRWWSNAAGNAVRGRAMK